MKELKKFREIKEEYFKQSEKFHNYYEKIYDIKKVMEYTKFIINKNYDDCIEIAFNEYFKTFNNNIIQILADNPPYAINEDGSKFWSGNKRIPIPLPFDPENKLFILYIKKYSEILTYSLSININNDDEYNKKKIISFKIDKFIPIDRKNIQNSYSKRYKMNKYESNEDKKLKKKKKFEEIEARIKKQKDKYGKLKKEAINLNLPDFNNILFKIK